MADRPTASTSGVGRPRTRSVHQTPCVPEVGRPRSKSVFQSKIKGSAKKNPTKQTVKPILQLEQQDIVVVIDPEEQEFPLPTDQLLALPSVDLEQIPNPQLNPPNQPLDLPTEEAEQPNPPLRSTLSASKSSSGASK